MNHQGIYAITHRETSRCYIGMSKHIEYRFSEHREALSRRWHPNPKLQNAWNKYGPHAFDFEILVECEFEDIREQLEISLIEKFGYYNLGKGGKGVDFTPEVREKMSASLKRARQDPQAQKNWSEGLKAAWAVGDKKKRGDAQAQGKREARQRLFFARSPEMQEIYKNQAHEFALKSCYPCPRREDYTCRKCTK